MVFYLHKEVTSDSPLVRLKDFLYTRDPITSSVNRILQTPVRLDADEIHILPSRFFYDQFKNLQDSIVIIGNTVRFYFSSKNPSIDKFYSELLKLIQNESSKKGLRTSVELIGKLPDFKNHLQNLQLSFYKKQRYDGLLLGQNLIEIKYSDNNDSKEALCTLKINQYQQIAYASQFISKGSEVIRKVLLFQEKAVEPGQRNYLTPEDDTKGFQSIRSISKGAVILKSDLKKELLVFAGQDIFVYFRSGAMEMRSPGRAYESGGKGDSVRIKPQDSDQYFDAKVIGNEEVLIEL